MAKETVRTAITDGEGNNKLLSVVQSTSDPTKYGLVICNPDGSPISGGLTALNNGQATTWNGAATAVDLGGTYDKDIDISSYNGSTIGISSYDGIGTYFRSFFAPSEFNDASRGQYTDIGNSEFVASLSSFQTSMRVYNGSDTNYFIVEPTTLYSNQYPNTRDESGPYRPANVLYTDDSGYFRSSSLPGFWTQLKPTDSGWGTLSSSTFATGTMSSSGLYTANAGITVASGNLTGTQCIMNIANGTAFASTHSLTGTNAQTTLAITETWNTTGTPNLINIALTDTASNAASNLFRYSVGGTVRVTISKLGSFNNDVSGAGANGITTGYDGGFNLSGSVGFIKRDTILGLGIQYNVAVSYINGHIFRGSANYTTTTGNVFLAQNIGTFAPTSGTATYTYQGISGTINQTGGANGIVRGLYVNPTITAAADFRAIETNIASGTNRRAMRHTGTASTFQAGKETFDATNTATGTTGAQTINKPSGTVNFAAGATSLVVTNSMCATTSIVYASVRTNDATAVIKNVVPAAGSFTINLTAAATAETSVGFILYN